MKIYNKILFLYCGKAVAKEQLLNYESIEKEVDEAVMAMSSDYKESGHNNVYLNTLNMAPTSSKRRIQ